MNNVPPRYWMVMGLALLVRVLWASLVPVEPISDSAAYDLLARNLANGQGYGMTINAPTAFWVPGTAMVYALLYRLFGHSYLPAVLLNLLLGTWIVGATMWLSEKWFDARVSIVAGLLVALWMNLIEFTTLLASELLFIALLLAALIVWQSRSRVRSLRAAILGVLFAISTYVRVIGLVLPIAFFILEYTRTRDWQPSFLTLLFAGTVMVGLLAPWSARNTMIFGQFVLLSTDGGAVLWQGITHDPFRERERELPMPAGYDQAQLDRYWTAQALEEIRAAPLDFVAGFFKRLLFMHSRESIGVVWNANGLTTRFGEGVLLPLKALNALYWFLALGLGLAGAAQLLKRRGARGAFLHPSVVLWFCLVVPVAVLSPQDRFHLTAVPFIAMLAGYGLVTMRTAVA